MATILKYHQGKMIPVNQDSKITNASDGNSDNETLGNSVYFQTKKLAMKKRFYGNLMMILVTAKIAFAMILITFLG